MQHGTGPLRNGFPGHFYIRPLGCARSRKIKSRRLYNGKINSVFHGETEKAVKLFQS